MSQFLFQSQTTDDTSEVIIDTGGAAVFVWGTFDGAVITGEHSPYGDEWFEDRDMRFTAKSIRDFVIRPSTRFRLKVSNAGASTSINAVITR